MLNNLDTENKIELYDCFTDKLELECDENDNILNITIIEDADDEGNSNKANFILSKDQGMKLIKFILNKWVF